MYLIAFPLLLIPFAIYNMVAFLLNMDFEERLFDVALLSGTSIAVSVGDVLVVIAVLLLYVEILKSTRLSTKTIVDHGLSVILFIVMVIEFITVQRAATSTFLILVALGFVDVIGGFTIAFRTAKRDVAFEGRNSRSQA
jgi:hypothetical protein